MRPLEDRQAALARDATFGLGKPVTPQRVCAGGRRMRALVCAPSNSALDEIVMRLLAAGLRGSSGEVYRPTVVRTGVQVCILPWLFSPCLSFLRQAKCGSGGAGVGSI